MIVTNLFLYELVLLICGAILFLALTVILILFAVKGRKIAALLPFYVIPFIMMGFPAFQSIKLSSSSIEIETKTTAFDKNPADSAAREELNEAVSEVTWERAKRNPETCLKLAKAKFTLGEYDSATKYVNYVIKTLPENTEAKDLKQRLDAEKNKQASYAEGIRSVENYLHKLRRNADNDSTAYKILSQKIDSLQLNPPKYITESQALVVAEAYAALRRTDDAKKIIADVKSANHKSKAADSLIYKIDSNKINSTYKVRYKAKFPAAKVRTATTKPLIYTKRK